jgi:hypothetical protein
MEGGAAMNGRDLVAKDAREQLRRWDAGEPIWTVEMGGIGPGYEQAIQVLAIEIVRDNLDQPLPADGDEAAWREFGMATAERIDVIGPDGKYSCGGFSGAQLGAARNLAARWLRIGPAAVHAEVPSDRHIQASRFWPHAPVAESTSTANSRAPQKEGN